MRCKQQEMKSVIATWKYRKRNKTFTCNKKSQASSKIAFYMKVTASSSFVGDSHIQLFCFLEQLLTSFDVRHVIILSYISFLFAYILTFVFWPHTVHVYCTVKQSSQTLKRNSLFFQFWLWKWKIYMHFTLSERPLNKTHQVALLCKTCKYSIHLACPYQNKMKGQIKTKNFSWSLHLNNDFAMKKNFLNHPFQTEMQQGYKPLSLIASNTLCKPEISQKYYSNQTKS